MPTSSRPIPAHLSTNLASSRSAQQLLKHCSSSRDAAPSRPHWAQIHNLEKESSRSWPFFAKLRSSFAAVGRSSTSRMAERQLFGNVSGSFIVAALVGLSRAIGIMTQGRGPPFGCRTGALPRHQSSPAFGVVEWRSRRRRTLQETSGPADVRGCWRQAHGGRHLRTDGRRVCRRSPGP